VIRHPDAGPSSSSGGSDDSGVFTENQGEVLFLAGGSAQVDGGANRPPTIQATFSTFALDDPDAGAACSQGAAGDCFWSSCTAGAPPGGAIHYVTAGTLTVTGATAPIVLMPSAADAGPFGPEYDWSPTPGGATFGPGSKLTLAASGDTVPPFMATVTIPDLLTVTSPAPDNTNTVTVFQSKDLPITWTGGTGGTIQVFLFQYTTTVNTQMSCQFPASGGTRTIPAATLANLALGGMAAFSPTVTGIGIFASNSAQAMAAGWTVNVSGTTPGLNAYLSVGQ
jgi:hypothetical protein